MTEAELYDSDRIELIKYATRLMSELTRIRSGVGTLKKYEVMVYETFSPDTITVSTTKAYKVSDIETLIGKENLVARSV